MPPRKPLSAFAEQLRALRAGLSLWPDRPRIIAMTAARPAEGKSHGHWRWAGWRR